MFLIRSACTVAIAVGGLHRCQQLLDLGLRNGDSLRVAEKVKQEFPEAKVVVLPYARYQLPRNAVRMDHADQRVFAYAGQT